MVKPQTNKIVAKVRRSSQADDSIVRRIKTICSDLEVCKMPFPQVIVTNNGIDLQWRSTSKALSLRVTSRGKMPFHNTRCLEDETGAAVGFVSDQGEIVRPRDVEHLMVWFLQDHAAQA